MTRTATIVFCLLSAVVCWSAGCNQATEDTPPVSARTASTTKTGVSPISDVQVTLPDIETGSPHALRAEGTFLPAAHGQQKPFEFEIPGRMHYRVRITCKPFVKEEWCINPLVDITHRSGPRLYAKYYAAFFDSDGQLVGCCGQDADKPPSATPLQLGSLVIRGPKERLQSATRFQIVIYESDQQIGSEPISAEATAALVGRGGEVISRLEQTASSVTPIAGQTELRLQAEVTFQDPAEKARNSHLRITGATEYDLYLSTRKQDVVLNHSNRPDERFDRWETDIEFDKRQRVKGVSTIVHAALLDAAGRLIVCSGASARQLAAPEDALLFARRLDLVTYETVRE